MKRHFKLFTCLGLLSLILAGCGRGGGDAEPGVDVGDGTEPGVDVGDGTDPYEEPLTHEHTWGEPTYTWSSDYLICTAKRVCTTDFTHIETETVHSPYSIVTPPTCDTDGLGRYTATFTNIAFETQTHDVTIDAFGHIWADPTYTWSSDYSTCTAKRVCLIDFSHKETEKVTSTYAVITEATCETEGLDRYTATFKSRAFTTQTFDVIIDELGHTWGEPTYTWSSDYSTCTAKRVCATDSTHIETETINSTYGVVTYATWKTEGLGRYTVTFENSAFEAQTHDVVLEIEPVGNAETPKLRGDGKTITYGLYPQTNVNDSTLVSALNELATPESNGWYLYGDEYYAKVSATPESSSYKFDNGTTIVNGTTYWFKCEPITWNVLSNDYGTYYLLSSVLLDAHRYAASSSSNNYANSEIRSWLNDDFYNSAFALDSSYILTTTVDNSASTTSSSDDPYVCDNTQDKVFLPSYKDYINSSYGFRRDINTSDTRCCKTTDWARARGADCNIYYEGYYWTRSPVWYVNSNGSLTNGLFLDYTELCVRPAITLNIS